MNIFISINDQVWLFLNNFVIENSLEKYVWYFSDAPIFFLPIFLLWAWLFYTFKIKNIEKKADLLNIVYWIILAIIINLIIQNIVHLDRPESIVKPILEHIPDASFPSDHAAVSFAFFTWILLAWYKKISYVFLVFAIIMNISRIAWWVHWFFDIIVWAIIWIFSAIFIFKYFKNTNINNKINNFIIKIMSYIKL